MLCALPAAAAAQRDARRPEGPSSAAVSDVRYTVAFDARRARTRTMRITMDMRASGDGPVLLSLPEWTPGAYEISRFSRWVTNFAAESDGKPLGWDKVDFDTWRVQRGNARAVRVSFDFVADTLDNAMSWARPDFVMFNGTNVFLYPEGRPLDFGSSVRIETEPDWRVATGMTQGGDPRTFTAASYHELVDMPFFVGQFELDSTELGDRWIRFATYPAGSVSRGERANVLQTFKRVVPPQAAVFGEIPWTTYTVLQIADSSYGGISGLEHTNSHVDITTPLAIGSLVLTTIYSHEFFHAWNVKRLRPAELWPYRYDAPQPTPLLWMSEGVTDYYGDVTLLRAEVVDSATFLRLTTDKMQEVLGAPAIALEDASLNTWVSPIDGTATIYYPKGALAGLLLDILIRDATDNRASLDDVMRTLYRDAYLKGQGFTNEQFWRTASAVAGGHSFDDFYRRYVDGREPYPWTTVLPLAGIRLVADSLREPRLGITTVRDSAGILVVDVEPQSASDEAGVREGDYVLAIGDLSVRDERFGELFRAMYGGKDSIPLTITVRRDGETLRLPGTLRQSVRVRLRLVPDANASAKAQRIRSGMFRGKTG
jgi:predicted metalloprotease with PDZ domain